MKCLVCALSIYVFEQACMRDLGDGLGSHPNIHALHLYLLILLFACNVPIDSSCAIRAPMCSFD